MDIAEEVFSGKRPIFENAIDFGFEPEVDGAESASDRNPSDALKYSESIMDGDLICEIIIYPDFTVKCSLTDSESGDAYDPLNIESYTGSYVGKVREEYRAVLERVAENCFMDMPSLSGKRKVKDGEKAYWIIPSNPSHYDVSAGFRNSPDNTIPWHHRINVMPGDIVYIYQTEPIAAIMFKTEVVESFLPRPSSWSHLAPSSKYSMNIRLIEKYDKEMFPRKLLNEHGIKKTVRGQRSAPLELVNLIESKSSLK